MKWLLEYHHIMLMKSMLLVIYHNYIFREILFKNIMNNKLELPSDISPLCSDLL